MRKILLSTIAFVAALFVACDGLDDGTKTIEFTDGTQPTQTFYADDTAGSVKFRAAGTWSATVVDATRASVDWLTLSRYSGDAGECEITVTLDENTTGEERTAKIIIICGDTSITITITQMPTKRDDSENPENPVPAPATIKMINGYQEYIVGANETEIVGGDIEFQAADVWSAGCQCDWITITPNKGNAGDNKIAIRLTQNTTGIDRVGEIAIRCLDYEYRITIIQQGSEYIEPEPKPEPDPDPTPENLLVSEINVSGSNENYRLIFEYDDQYRVVKMTRYNSDSNADDVYNITYDNNTVSYKCGEDSGRITLDNNGRAVSGERKGYWYSYTLSYNSDGYLSHSLINGKEDNKIEYTITYSDSEMRISYTNSNGKPDYDTAIYKHIYVNSANIDLNWLVGSSEALSWVAGDCENIFAMLGYAGKRAFDMVDEVIAHAGDNTDPDYCITRYEYKNGYDNFYMPVTEIIETNSRNSDIIKYTILYQNK